MSRKSTTRILSIFSADAAINTPVSFSDHDGDLGIQRCYDSCPLIATLCPELCDRLVQDAHRMQAILIDFSFFSQPQ